MRVADIFTLNKTLLTAREISVLDRFQCNSYFYIRHSLTCPTNKIHADSDLVKVEVTTFCTDLFCV